MTIAIGLLWKENRKPCWELPDNASAVATNSGAAKYQDQNLQQEARIARADNSALV